MPNLACMKISGFYKQKGNQVCLLTEYSGINEFDKVYLSKVFTDTKCPSEVLAMKHIEFGGSGFYLDCAPGLPEEVEHSMPDYSLYETWLAGKGEAGRKSKQYKYYRNYSIGYLTRGCFRQCPFCINKNTRKAVAASPLLEFYQPSKKKICLLDDNFLACEEWARMLGELRELGLPVQFRQGLDIRLITPIKAEMLASCRLDGDLLFAFDDIRDKDIIVEKLKIVNSVFQGRTRIKLYVLTGFDSQGCYDKEFWMKDIFQTFERVRILMEQRAYPYIMRYANYQQSPYRGMYINLARWCNQPQFFRNFSFREFCQLSKEGSACRRYLEAFEKEHPEIRRYMDMKFSD